MARPSARERRRAGQAAASHPQPRPHVRPRRRRGGLRDAGRRRAAPGDAPGPAEHNRLRHEPPARDRGPALRDPVVPRFVLAPSLLPGPRDPRGAPSRRDRRGAAHARPRGRALDGLGMARGRRVPRAGGRRRRPLGRGGPAARFLRGGLVSRAVGTDWQRRTLRTPAPQPMRLLARGGRILLLLLSVTGCAVEPPRPVLLPPDDGSGTVALVPPPVI